MITCTRFSGNAVSLFAALFTLPCFLSAGTLNFTIKGGYFTDEQGQRLVQADPAENSAVFQLINLGPNGVFDPPEAGSWTGGDDSLIDEVFDTTGQSAAAFSLGGFSRISPYEGRLLRSFSLPETSDYFAAGDQVGLRWYPGVTIAQFAPEQGPPEGAYYGEVHLGEKHSYPDDPAYSAWTLPSSGTLSVEFDPPVSTDYQVENAESSPALVATPEFTGSPNMQIGTGAVVPIPFFVPLASVLVAVGSVFMRHRNHTRR